MNNDIEKALCDVRKAHRLIYEFQKRMQDIITFIRQRCDLEKEDSFEKQYSFPIKNKINHDNWAWDLIYSYMCEYGIGKKDSQDGRSYKLSVVQYADTGFFEKEGGLKNDLTTFETEDESGTKLLFHLESVPADLDDKWKYWYGQRQNLFHTKEYASKKFDRKVFQPEGMGDIYVVLYSVPLEKFMTEESTKEVLRDFVKYCNENAKTDLKLLF